MLTTVQVQLDPEYLKWPRACVCCGAPDERDLEMAVPSTDTDEHESDLIMEVRIPYCLACYAHTGMRVAWGRIVAILAALALLALVAENVFSMDAVAPHVKSLIAGGSGLACIAACVGYVAWELFLIKRSMKSSCSAPRNQVVFFHPTSSRISTLSFSNPRIADDFRELNWFNVIQF